MSTPTTEQEWTQARILAEFQTVAGIDCVALADAINASIAAERETVKEKIEVIYKLIAEKTELHAQLAEYKDRYSDMKTCAEVNLDSAKHFKTQLAAAQAAIALARICLWRLREEKRAIVDSHGEDAVPAYLNRCIKHFSDFAKQPADTAALDAAIADAYDHARKEADRDWQDVLDVAQQPLVELARFLKSVIQSGEPWTQTCQKQYNDALAKVKK